MVSERTAEQERIQLARKARDEAEQVLARLLVDRERSEERLQEAGKRDPVTFVTGSSALDRAIAATREMIQSMDELLARPRAEPPSPTVLPHAAVGEARQVAAGGGKTTIRSAVAP